MVNTAETLFEPQADDSVARITDSEARIALKRVNAYWEDPEDAFVDEITETEISYADAKVLVDRVGEVWGEDIAERVKAFAREDPESQDKAPSVRAGWCLKPFVFGSVACLCALAVCAAGLLMLIDTETAPVTTSIATDEVTQTALADVAPAEVATLQPISKDETEEHMQPRIVSEGAVVASIEAHQAGPRIQIRDVAISQSRSSWRFSAEVEGEMFQIAGVALGPEFSYPYQGLEALGFDGNTRTAFVRQMHNTQGIDVNNLQFGDRLVLVSHAKLGSQSAPQVTVSLISSEPELAGTTETSDCTQTVHGKMFGPHPELIQQASSALRAYDAEIAAYQCVLESSAGF